MGIQATEKGLALIKQAREQKRWRVQEQSWCEMASVSLPTLKRFLHGDSVSESSFQSICKAVGVNWQLVAGREPCLSFHGFLVYSPTEWVGRSSLITTLLQKFESGLRVMILTGIAGIGKTTLAERLVEHLEPSGLSGNWSGFVRENLESYRSLGESSNEESPPFYVSVVVNLLEKCGVKITPDIQQNESKLSQMLVKRLQEEKFLIVIDSLEEVLEGNQETGLSQFREKGWVGLLQKILSIQNCQSRLILTSRDFPSDLRIIGSRYERMWHAEAIRGLTESEQIEFFEKKGLDVEIGSSSQRFLNRIGKAYEGHPLALKIIAGEIGFPPFYGNVSAYWARYGSEIESVEKALAEAEKMYQTVGSGDRWRLHSFTNNLQMQVQKRLDLTLSRLKSEAHNAYVLLCESSVYRSFVPEKFWLRHLDLWNIDQSQQEAALYVLRDRYLVEESLVNLDQIYFRQHNLIRSISLEHLKQLEGSND